MRKLEHSKLLLRQQRQITTKETIPVSVVLNNVRSLYNVGSIFRTADGCGVEKIWLCGITGAPGTARSRIEKTALGAEKRVPWEYRKDPLIPVRELKKKGYEIVLLEQIEESIPYQDYEPEKHIFGEERQVLPEKCSRKGAQCLFVLLSEMKSQAFPMNCLRLRIARLKLRCRGLRILLTSPSLSESRPTTLRIV